MGEVLSSSNKEPRAILRLREMTKSFGGIMAVNRVSFEVMEQEIRALIGPNGAGKTTVLNLISLFYRPDHGTIEFAGTDINSFQPHKLAALGLARTFQQVQMSGHMSVMESVMVGMHCTTKGEMFKAIFGTLGRQEGRVRERAESILEFLNLQHLRKALTASLSWGDRRRVELGKALAGDPKLLMLDEPAAGLTQVEIDELAQLLEKIKALGISILLVEHHVPLVMSIADKVVVLNFGRKIAEGTPEEVAGTSEVVNAYLGGEELLCSN